MSKFHYVYRITNKLTNTSYYGKRSSNLEPKDDLGVIYFSSSRYLKNDIKLYGLTNFKFKIIKQFETALEAINFESIIHNRLNVKDSANFYNKVNQTSSKFDTTGMCCVINIDTNLTEHIHISELKHHHKHIHKGKVNVVDDSGVIINVDVDDPRIGVELQYIRLGTVYITNDETDQTLCISESDISNYDSSIWRRGNKRGNINKIGHSTYRNTITGEIEFVDGNDPRIGVDLEHINKNTASVKNIKTGEVVRLDINDPRIGREFVGHTTGFATYININTGKHEYIQKDDPRIGIDYIHGNLGQNVYINIKTGEKVKLYTDDPRIGTEFRHNNKGKGTYRNIHTDKCEKLFTNDPRIGVDFVGTGTKKEKYIDENGQTLYLYKIDYRVKSKIVKRVN